VIKKTEVALILEISFEICEWRSDIAALVTLVSYGSLGPQRARLRCPLCPDKPTWLARLVMSEKCQLQTTD
jgi:hypothetical protein